MGKKESSYYMVGGINLKKRVFISHPFRGNEEENTKKVDKICRNIMEEEDDKLLISPLHLWSFMSEDKDYRDVIMDFCMRMISNCEEVWFFKYGELSSGQQMEFDYAVELEKNIKIIEMG